MRTFVSRICNDSSSKVRPWARGFTLIEILVVLFIVSVMTGIVVSSIPALVVTDTFDTEMRRLKALMTLAHDEAVSASAELGFRTEGFGYEFVRYDDEGKHWVTLDERPFRPRQLEEGQFLSLRIEDVPLTIGEDEPPAVLILSSGEVTPFELRLKDDLGSRILTADGYGGFEWDNGNEG